MEIKKINIALLLALLSLLVIVSCGRNRANDILLETDQYMKTEPQKALQILDSLEDAGNLNEEELMHLVWNRAVAHQTLGMSLADDEQLLNAVAYFRTDADKQADSYLLEASYLVWKGKETDAIKAIDRGLTEIRDSSNLVKMLMLKADIFEGRHEYKKAVEVLMEALEYGLPKREQALLNYKIGLSLSLMGDKQSEQFYSESIRLATENGDTAIACEFLRNYADYLANNGQYRQSNDMYYEIGRIMPEVSDLSAIQMAMAGNYINLHLLDSARICNDKAIESEAELESRGYADIARRMAMEQERYLLDYASGKNVSYVNFARYCDSITRDMQMKEKTSTQRLESKNRLQSVNYELKLGKQRLGWMLSIAILLLIGGTIGIYVYHKNRIQRQVDAEDRIDTLSRMLSEAQTAMTKETADKELTETGDDAFFKKILLQQLGIIRLVASTPTNQNQALLKRISAIGGGAIPTNSLLIWADLYPVIDRLYDNFYTRLKEHFGDTLTEKEVQICCLLCAGFSTKEISVVTQQSDATIYVRKTSIRKKIGASEGQDIVAYVNSIKD